jgi:hypothetical protein
MASNGKLPRAQSAVVLYYQLNYDLSIVARPVRSLSLMAALALFRKPFQVGIVKNTIPSKVPLVERLNQSQKGGRPSKIPPLKPGIGSLMRAQLIGRKFLLHCLVSRIIDFTRRDGIPF